VFFFFSVVHFSVSGLAIWFFFIFVIKAVFLCLSGVFALWTVPVLRLSFFSRFPYRLGWCYVPFISLHSFHASRTHPRHLHRSCRLKADENIAVPSAGGAS